MSHNSTSAPLAVSKESSQLIEPLVQAARDIRRCCSPAVRSPRCPTSPHHPQGDYAVDRLGQLGRADKTRSRRSVNSAASWLSLEAQRTRSSRTRCSVWFRRKTQKLSFITTRTSQFLIGGSRMRSWFSQARRNACWQTSAAASALAGPHRPSGGRSAPAGEYGRPTVSANRPHHPPQRLPSAPSGT